MKVRYVPDFQWFEYLSPVTAPVRGEIILEGLPLSVGLHKRKEIRRRRTTIAWNFIILLEKAL